jgi:hypothetical protein
LYAVSAHKHRNFSRQDAKKKYNMALDQYDFNFSIFASCLQDVGKGREQERKLWRELFLYGWKPGNHNHHTTLLQPNLYR